MQHPLPTLGTRTLRYIEGNDLADELARLGPSSTPIGPEPFLPIRRSAVSSAIIAHLSRLTNQRWESSTVSSKCKLPIQAILRPLHPTEILRPYSKLITGHSLFNYFQHRTGIGASPTCAACGDEDETSEHLLCRITAVASFFFTRTMSGRPASIT